MNRVMLIGRLTAKPELRYTGTNTPYSRFTLAVNRTFSNQDGQREADFIGIVVWRKQAENVCNYLDKGSLVSIEGKLQTGSFEKDGVKQYTMDVIGDSVQFLDSKKESKREPQDVSPYDYQNQDLHNTRQDYAQTDAFSDFGDAVSIDANFLD